MVSALVRAADERDLALARARLRERMEAFDRGEELPHPNIAGRLWSDPVAAASATAQSSTAAWVNLRSGWSRTRASALSK